MISELPINAAEPGAHGAVATVQSADRVMPDPRVCGHVVKMVVVAAPPSPDGVLLAGLRNRDQRAFETLVRRHGPRMLATAKRFFRCEHEAADALQDAFLSAFKSIDSFSGGSTLATWLHRIVVNACLMKLRSRSRRREVSIDDQPPQFDSTGRFSFRPRDIPDSDDGRQSAESAACSAELREHVRDCVEILPESYRQVLLLRDIEQLDTDQTASLLGTTPGNVKTRLHRARQALRTLIQPVFM